MYSRILQGVLLVAFEAWLDVSAKLFIAFKERGCDTADISQLMLASLRAQHLGMGCKELWPEESDQVVDAIVGAGNDMDLKAADGDLPN